MQRKLLDLQEFNGPGTDLQPSLAEGKPIGMQEVSQAVSGSKELSLDSQGFQGKQTSIPSDKVSRCHVLLSTSNSS